MKVINLPWVEKYRPKSRTDLVGNDTVISQLLEFLSTWNHKKSRPAILLVGPPGCGKTSVTHAIANDLDFLVTEVNASDARSKNRINDALRITSEFQRLDFEDKKQLILMDEVDGLSGRYDRGGLNEFMKILKNTKYPVICTANDPESDKILTLMRRMKIRKLDFHRLEEYEIISLLEKIASKENFNLDENILEKIAENSAGDIRAAINELESLYYGKEIGNLEKRDKAKVLTETFNDLYRAKNYHEASRVWSNAPSTYLPLLLHLFDQTSKQCRTSEELYKSYVQIANADLVLTRIMKTQNWGLLKYFFAFIGPGIALSKDPKYFNRISKLNNLPNQFKLRGIAKNKHAKASLLAPKIVSNLHISTRKFVFEEFDLFVKILTGRKGAEIAAWLDLDDDELDILQKLNPLSTIIEDIDEARRVVGLARRDQGMRVKTDDFYDHFNSVNIVSVNVKDSAEKNVEEEIIEDQKENLQQSLDDFF
ncbi:MAG: replication factor C large subunit [Candidatus Heimdallarchaeota archaeon]|nr:replication factor C large subunit [Candidatus Heimdallarchaeota archaeon]